MSDKIQFEKIKTGTPNATTHLAFKSGYLRIDYDDDGWVALIGYGKAKDDPCHEMQLYFDWNNERVTFTSEGSLAGVFWSHGQVYGGTVYESPEPEFVNSIELGDWVEQCILEMVSLAHSP